MHEIQGHWGKWNITESICKVYALKIRVYISADQIWGPQNLLHIGYRGRKAAGREPDSPPPFSAEIKDAWSYTSTPPYVLMVGA
jgi:hypothetical protein